jgi:sugar phosphate isomerase/epimerase
VLSGLSRIGYDGWLMVEQDSSWLPPAEAAAIGLRVLRFALRQVTV